MATDPKTAVRPPADEAAVIDFTNPRDFQAFIKRMLALEARVKTLEDQLSQGRQTTNQVSPQDEPPKTDRGESKPTPFRGDVHDPD